MNKLILTDKKLILLFLLIKCFEGFFFQVNLNFLFSLHF